MKHSARTRTMVKMAELAIAAPQVVAMRTARAMAAGAAPTTSDRTEFVQMSTEKVQAFWESMFAMGVQIARTQQEYAQTIAVQCCRAWSTPWWAVASRPFLPGMSALPRAAALVTGPSKRQRERAVQGLVAAGLGPIHKTATANARRLARVKKR
jgi:hypothetical protein